MDSTETDRFHPRRKFYRAALLERINVFPSVTQKAGESEFEPGAFGWEPPCRATEGLLL